jgi:hypothetical protein
MDTFHFVTERYNKAGATYHNGTASLLLVFKITLSTRMPIRQVRILNAGRITVCPDLYLLFNRYRQI